MYHTYYNATSKLIGYARVDSTANAVDDGWQFYGCGGRPNGIGCNDSTLVYAPLASGPGGSGRPDVVYFGTDRLYRSTDKGVSNAIVSQAPLVQGVPISAIGISPQNDSVRIVGLKNGRVFATTTGSSTLTEITGAIPSAFVGRAVIDPDNAGTAYVSLGGYLGSSAHVWKTTNFGAAAPTWSPAGAGIPDVPVNAFAVDPSNSQVLFAGTDIGVWRSGDGGSSWSPLGTGLPVVAVFDMNVAARSAPGQTLRIATHGRGMWEVPIPPTPVVPGPAYNPLTPARILDTRDGTGAPAAAVGPGRSIDLTVAGVGGVPVSGVGAVALNVAVTGASAPSFLTVWPTGEARPLAANENFAAGQTTSNLVVAKVGAGGKVSIYNNSGSTQVIGDVQGWFPS